MKKSIAAILICLLPLSLYAADQPIGGIKLLEGYKIKKDWAVDAAAWTIYKDGGLIIECEAGMNEGLWADAKQRDNSRSPELGNILLVTFPLGIQADHAANFKAEILNEQELADALLMVLTFDPTKG